ncbi:MAG: hypothetical protein DRO11_03155 [Methanobacteriota archaeon]|nr:MAG: hypothetical protein DRO11_03155 [Euryarchaeota archaeon]
MANATREINELETISVESVTVGKSNIIMPAWMQDEEDEEKETKTEIKNLAKFYVMSAITNDIESSIEAGGANMDMIAEMEKQAARVEKFLGLK